MFVSFAWPGAKNIQSLTLVLLQMKLQYGLFSVQYVHNSEIQVSYTYVNVFIVWFLADISKKQ